MTELATDTPNLTLPLLQPAQAQKHVTVNEALVRLDGAAQLVLAALDVTAPPAAAVPGTCYGVPPGAVEAWAGQAGRVAVAVSGGWVFLPARRGWRAFVLATGTPALHDGSLWRPGALSLSPGGAGLALAAAEIDLDLGPGASVTSPVVVPARALLLGVTGRVTEAITGTASAWQLGLPGAPDRFGTGLGLAAASWVNGPVAPEVLWTPTPLLVSATGGDFATGRLRLVAHYATLALPDPA